MLIIDGHNLIPCVPGLSLEEIDDEMALVKLLQVYSRIKRKQVVVFFDGAPVGQAGSRSYGTIRAHFVPYGLTADDAIRRYLEDLKGAARAAAVVSNDRMVRSNAVELHAAVIRSEQFARDLLSTVTAAGMSSDIRTPPAEGKAAPKAAGKPGAKKPPDAKKAPAQGANPSSAISDGSAAGSASSGAASSGSLDEWYEVFGIDASEAEKPIEPPEGQRRRYRGRSSAPQSPPPASQPPPQKGKGKPPRRR